MLQQYTIFETFGSNGQNFGFGDTAVPHPKGEKSCAGLICPSCKILCRSVRPSPRYL